MKIFLKSYLNIVATSLIGLVFMIASFFLIINYYHYEELNKPFYVSENDVFHKIYKGKLEKVNTNLQKFNGSAYHEYHPYKTMYNHLLSCYKVMNSENIYSNMKTNAYYTPKEVFDLGSKFQTDIINVCWALHLSYLKEDDVPKEFQDVSKVIASEVNTITNQVNNALSEIQNNSSYFYTTNVTSATVRNYLLSDYTAISNSYSEFADIIVLLSDMINNGGKND